MPSAESPVARPSSPSAFRRHPLLWVPTLYLAMGIPFNAVMSGTAANMYKSLGYSNAQITVALGSIGIAWSLKPLWAAFLDMYRTKKFFVLSMELLLGVIFASIAMVLPVSGFFQISIALLWIAAFASSTQDICADGIYLTALDKPTQSRFAGVQGMFWVSGKIIATGGFIYSMSLLKDAFGWTEVRMWQGVMGACAAAMLVMFVYHHFMLPTGSVSHRPHSFRQVLREFGGTAVTFFHKRAFWGMIAFVFFYRLGEGLILIEGQLFLRSSVESGGLGMTAGQVSAIDAGWGTGANILGGLLGGWFVGRRGLSRSLWFLGLCLNVPHITFVILSHIAANHHGASYATITTLVSLEKFGYGFGMVGNMIYMMQQLAPGRSTMTHYAFATALMNLVLVPTNMISGPLAELLGFSTYFIVVMFASVPSIWAAWKAPFPLNQNTAKEARDEAGGEVVITEDDPQHVSGILRKVQLLAGKTSMFAMLNILTILVVDAKILGSLQGKAAGESQTQVMMLLGSALLKIFLALQTFKLARQSATAAVGEEAAAMPYLKNARGALIATWICAAVSVAVLVFAFRIA